MDLGPPELLIIGIVLLLLFGSSKLPQLARNLGRAQTELKKGLAEGRGDGDHRAGSTSKQVAADGESARPDPPPTEMT